MITRPTGVLGMAELVGDGADVDVRTGDCGKPLRVDQGCERAVTDVHDDGSAQRLTPAPFHTITSSTTRRGERRKLPPVVSATGIRQVWSHEVGMPRILAIAG